MAILITDEEEGRGMLIADEMLITDEEDGRGWPRMAAECTVYQLLRGGCNKETSFI